MFLFSKSFLKFAMVFITKKKIEKKSGVAEAFCWSLIKEIKIKIKMKNFLPPKLAKKIKKPDNVKYWWRQPQTHASLYTERQKCN